MNMKTVAACPAGLGNRIKCLVSTMWINEGGETSVHWPVNEECGCEYDKLFENRWSIELVDAIPKGSIINKSYKLKLCEEELDFKYDKLQRSKMNELIPYFKFLKPKQDIQDAVWAFMNKYKDSFDNGEMIGVHIRKGDFKGFHDGRDKISTEDKFIERMKSLLKINPNYKFLLCTEDEETENKFKEIFNKQTIVYFPKKFRGRDTANSIKEAFVDMLLLSKCSTIVGTFLSTFTEVAWWLSGCNAEIIIPGEEETKEVSKVLSKLPKEGEGIHKKVWRKLKTWGL